MKFNNARIAENAIIDLHVHSRGSWDGFSTVQENIMVAKSRGYSVIGCVEHDSFPELSQPLNFFDGVCVLAGVELSVYPFHVLAFGKINDRLGLLAKVSKLSNIEVLEYLSDSGYYSVLAHPFRLKEILRSRGFRLINEMVSKAFFVEAVNGRSFVSNLFAQFKVPREKSVAGSDSHHMYEIGNAYTVADSLDVSSIDSLFHSLKKASKKNIHNPNLYSLFYSRYLKFKERRKKIW